MTSFEKSDFESKLKRLVAHLRIEDEESKDNLRNDILANMDNIMWNIDDALSSVIPAIKDRRLRNDCRRLLLAKKLNVAEDYHGKRSSVQPYIDYVSDDCVLLQYPEEDPSQTSMAILSPSGVIKTPKGYFWINGRTLSYRWCFTARGVGKNRNKYGLVYGDGRILLPCIFNYIENDVVIEAQYRGVAFGISLKEEKFEPKEYQVSEDLFLNISCLGLKTEHSYDESAAAPLYDGKPFETPEEKKTYENQVKEELSSILDEFYKAPESWLENNRGI